MNQLLTSILLLCLSNMSTNLSTLNDPDKGKEFHPELLAYITQLKYPNPDAERKESLTDLINWIAEKKSKGQPAELTFICTHNSRRSHFAQIWAQIAADYYHLPHVRTYSGGTEATAFNKWAVKAIERCGVHVSNPGGDNPHYELSYSKGSKSITCYSKKFSDPANPSANFCAVMTCSQADAACPIVPGAEFRVSLPYNDPKEADDNPQEQERYDERCRQIASEMFYILRQVASKQ